MQDRVRDVARSAFMIILLPACVGDASESGLWTQRDSAGIQIIESGIPEQEWTVDPEADLRIGSLDRDSTQLLDEVVYAAWLPDASVVVADDGLDQVRVYDSAGRHVLTRGGPGEGPAEFSRMQTALLLGADTIVIFDPRLRRLTWLPLQDGSPRELHVDLIPSGEFRLIGRTSSQGLVFEQMESHPDVSSADYQYQRDTVALRVYGPTEQGETILRAPGSEALFYIGTNASGRPSYTLRMPLPFAARVQSTIANDEIVTAHGLNRQIETRDMAGSLRRITRVASTTAALTQTQRERFIEHNVEESAGNMDAVTARKNAEVWLGILSADHKVPPFDQIIVDTSGYVWVRDYMMPWESNEPQHWTVLDAESRPAARVRTPAGVTVTQVAEDRIVGVARGAFDEQYVVVHRLQR